MLTKMTTKDSTLESGEERKGESGEGKDQDGTWWMVSVKGWAVQHTRTHPSPRGGKWKQNIAKESWIKHEDRTPDIRRKATKRRGHNWFSDGLSRRMSKWVSISTSEIWSLSLLLLHASTEVLFVRTVPAERGEDMISRREKALTVLVLKGLHSYRWKKSRTRANKRTESQSSLTA